MLAAGCRWLQGWLAPSPLSSLSLALSLSRETERGEFQEKIASSIILHYYSKIIPEKGSTHAREVQKRRLDFFTTNSHCSSIYNKKCSCPKIRNKIQSTVKNQRISSMFIFLSLVAVSLICLVTAYPVEIAKVSTKTLECSSQTIALYNDSAVSATEDELFMHVDKLCNSTMNNFCSWFEKNTTEIVFNYTDIKANIHFTNLKEACRSAGGNFCEVTYLISLKNSTNFVDDDYFYDDDSVDDKATGSTANILTLRSENSPWCFAKDVCGSTDIKEFILEQSVNFYGGIAMSDYNLTKIQCA